MIHKGVSMTTYKVLNLFARQIERNVEEKIVITPSSVDEKGVVVKVSLLKTWIAAKPVGSLATRSARIRVSVCGRAESLTGLELAVHAVEKLDRFFEQIPGGDRLCNEDGSIIPNTRIVTAVSEEDSFIDSPDTTEVQDVQDDRICIISFPEGEDE